MLTVIIMTLFDGATMILSNDNITIEYSEEGGFIFNSMTGEFYELNASGAFLVKQLASGSGCRDKLVDALAAKYKICLQSARSDTEDFLDRLEDYGFETCR